MSKYDNLNLDYTEVGILTSVCNKYKPGYQTFYVQALNPLNYKSNTVSTAHASTSNSINANKPKAGTINYGSNLRIELPKEVARQFPTKYIPPGTRFLISFLGGDINKPVVVGRDYDGYDNESDEPAIE